MEIKTLSPRTQAIHTARQVLAQRPVFLDTETTGADKNAEIIEISFVDDEGKVILDSLVKPNRPIPPDMTAIHGITDDMVANSQRFPVLWQTIRPLVQSKIIATYNADFDMAMLRQSITIYNLPWKENLRSFCIMKLYAQFRGDWDPIRRSFRYHKLEKARQHCGIEIPNAHRAAADALLARALLLCIAGTET